MLDPTTREIAQYQASQALSAPAPRLRPDATAHQLRIAAVSAGAIDASFGELNFRQLFPSLDRGIYCAHHAVGRPSTQLFPALKQHLRLLEQFGMGAFDRGWETLAPRFDERVRSLLRQTGGGVVHVQNFSDGLSAVLFSGLRGTLLCGADHFTSARYLHAQYGRQTGSAVIELAGDGDTWVPTEQYLSALTPDTAIVSISSAHWRTGQVHDLGALLEGMERICPHAVLLLDVYQTLGTVELPLTQVPVRTALIGGGVKQLHTGVGCGFVWATEALLEELTPNRSGWFAHADPFAFASDFVPAEGAARLQTGVPNLTAMAAFLAETDVLLTLGADPLTRIQARIATTIADAVVFSMELGLEVAGAPRAAFVAIRSDRGAEILEAVAGAGVVIDWRPDVAEGSVGLLRLSTSAAAFSYELLYALELVRNA